MISLVMDLCSPCASSFVLVVARKKSECRGKEREIGKKGGGRKCVRHHESSHVQEKTRHKQGNARWRGNLFSKNLFLIKN